jgi:hypothetical protein
MDNWSQENNTNINLYADKSYYYVTIGSIDGKRIGQTIQPSASPTLNLTTFDDYQFHEVDLTNIGRVGKNLVWRNFILDNEQTFDFNFPNIVTTEPAKIDVHVGANSVVDTNFSVTVNGQNVGTLQLSSVALNSGNVASMIHCH